MEGEIDEFYGDGIQSCWVFWGEVREWGSAAAVEEDVEELAV